MKTVNLPLKNNNKSIYHYFNLFQIRLLIIYKESCISATCPHPSTASSRNQIKFSRGWTKGGPFSMDGCFSVYVLNTTEAPLLFFKQRNLEGVRVDSGTGQKQKGGRG